MTTDLDELSAHLAAVLSANKDRPTISGIERLKGGYSRRMWAFDATDATGDRSGWILCTDAPDGVVGPDALTRMSEATLLTHVHRAGLPVPSIAASGDGSEPFGADWFIMARLAGTAAVGPLLRDPEISALRPAFGIEKAEILARIHALDVPEALEPIPGPDTIADRETQRWATALTHTPSARTKVTDAAFERLRLSTPRPPLRPCVVHGDYRTGNLLYDRTGITGVLDWEMAHVGDPIEDLAWAQLAAWRFGTGLVGGLLSDDEWLAAYERATGRLVDRDALRFWQLLTGVKMSLLAWRAVERTAPGKEHDLLRSLFLGLQDQLEQNLS